MCNNKTKQLRSLGNYDGRFVYKMLSPLTPKVTEKLLPGTRLYNKRYKTEEILLKGRIPDTSHRNLKELPAWQYNIATS